MLRILCLFFISLHTHAAFQDIWKGYQVSYINEIRNIETEAVENNFDFAISSNSWNLKLTTEYDDTFLDALFSFQAQKTIKQTNTIAIEKNTFKFGTFSYTISNTRYDLSEWDSNVGSSNADEIFETRGTFLYTVDFFNRSNSFEQDRIVQNQVFESSQNTAQRQKEYLDFFRSYLDAKLSVYLRNLAYEIEKRAKRRFNVISKRVKDGVSRKVEKLQAQSSLLKQKQEINKSENALKENLAIIEIVIRQEVPEEYLDKVTWKYIPFETWKQSISQKVNYEMKTLEERLRLIDIETDKLADQRGHSLKLQASYVSNSFNEENGDSFDEALNSPENDSKIISLMYTVPFGQSFRKATMERARINKKRIEYQKLDLKEKIEMNRKVLLHNIAKFEKSYNLSTRLVSLNKSIMNEQNKLYLRGQSTFDDVIRAEEGYINATIEEKRALHNLETLIVEYAYLMGSIEDVIKRYDD